MLHLPTTRILFLTMAIIYGQAAFGLTVNVDFEGNPATDATYNGDDGILSSTGGTVWNSLSQPGNTLLLDEFGNQTSIGITMQGSQYPGSEMATNSLQDSGTSDWIAITGLNPSLTYTLAIYAMENSSGIVVDATGPFTHSFYLNIDHTYVMPGEEGKDFDLCDGVIPFDLGGGIYGIQFEYVDGGIAGLQLQASPVPLPAAFWLFGSGLLGMLGLNKRKKLA